MDGVSPVMPDDLWSIDQVARYWGVSRSRARARLADRGIKRVSGYSANAVRADQPRQGYRKDLRDGRLIRTEDLLILAHPELHEPTEHWHEMLEYLLGVPLEADELPEASDAVAEALKCRYSWLRGPERATDPTTIRWWMLEILRDHKEVERIPPLPSGTWKPNTNPGR